MSVQCNTYILRGALLPYADFKDRYDDLEPYMDSAFKGVHHHNGLCVIYDGMNGKYVAIGRVLAKTENHQGFDAPFTVSPATDHEDDMLRALVGSLARREVEIGTHIISHYR